MCLEVGPSLASCDQTDRDVDPHGVDRARGIEETLQGALQPVVACPVAGLHEHRFDVPIVVEDDPHPAPLTTIDPENPHVRKVAFGDVGRCKRSFRSLGPPRS